MTRLKVVGLVHTGVSDNCTGQILQENFHISCMAFLGCWRALLKPEHSRGALLLLLFHNPYQQSQFLRSLDSKPDKTALILGFCCYPLTSGKQAINQSKKLLQTSGFTCVISKIQWQVSNMPARPVEGLVRQEMPLYRTHQMDYKRHPQVFTEEPSAFSVVYSGS
jgi:hypothetical protein